MADNLTLPASGGVVATDDIGGVHYQKLKSTWGADGVANDVTEDTPMPFGVAGSYFITSTANSSTANLAASATFVGTIESTVSQPSISYLVVTDQPITLTISQYVDLAGTYPVNNIVRYIDAGSGYSESFPINGDYIRVSAQNTGTAITANFNLNVGFGTIPSADKLGRMPVSAADAIPLLTQTLTTATSSTVMDTTGYQSVVTQITGVWQGFGIFESSNNQTDWDTVLVLSRDNVTLLDIVTSGGLYSVKPSGRYLRFRLTSITGSLVLNSIGRASQGISGADMLSLAMDRLNNSPLHVSLDDLSFQKLSPIQPLTQIGFYSVTGVVPINTQIMTVDCSNFRSLSMQWVTGTACVITPEWSNDGTAFFPATTFDQANNAGTTLAAASSGLRVTNIIARYFRLRVTTAASALLTQVVLFAGTQPLTAPLTTQPVSGTVTANIGTGALAAGTNAIGDVGLQYRANATGAATTYKFTAAATVNNILILTGARRLLGWSLTNTTATFKYFRFYNLAAQPASGASPTFMVGIPPNSTVLSPPVVGGIGMALGLGIACTNGVGDTDATVTVANDVVGSIFYV